MKLLAPVIHLTLETTTKEYEVQLKEEDEANTYQISLRLILRYKHPNNSACEKA